MPKLSRRALISTAVVAAGALLAPAAATATPLRPDPVRALERAAFPLHSTEPGGSHRDLRALGRMIGDATVVGLGEATHGSHEFFAMKERVFRYLVAEKGFRAFALEMSWPAGLKIDEFVRTGRGSAREVVAQQLGGTPWDREEFVNLIDWMREHNRRNPQDTVRFVGDDVGLARSADRFYDRITGWVRQHHPSALPRLTELYAELSRLADDQVLFHKPQPERERLAAQAAQALALIRGLPGAGPDLELVRQHARSVADTTALYARDFADPAQMREGHRLRDRAMAGYVIWWQRHTGQKTLVSAHNGHIALAADMPEVYPRVQGQVLRERLGARYLAAGFTFDRGSLLSQGGGRPGWTEFSVAAAGPGLNEHTLDRVRHRDFYLDLRTAPAAAREWLAVARPTRAIGTVFPQPDLEIALGRAYDVLIHLHQVQAAVVRR